MAQTLETLPEKLDDVPDEHIRQCGLDPDAPDIRRDLEHPCGLSGGHVFRCIEGRKVPADDLAERSVRVPRIGGRLLRDPFPPSQRSTTMPVDPPDAETVEAVRVQAGEEGMCPTCNRPLGGRHVEIEHADAHARQDAMLQALRGLTQRERSVVVLRRATT